MFKEQTDTFIRRSPHTTKFANTGKKDQLSLFIDEYLKVVLYYIDYLWNTQIEYNNKVFSILGDNLECPSFLSTTDYPNPTLLSQRAIKCACTQACSMIKTVVDKRKRLLWILNKLKNENQPTKSIEDKLKQKKYTLTKPIIKDKNNFKCELNSICVEFLEEEESNSFDLFINLKSLGKIDPIKIPIKHHRQSNKWKKRGTRLNSILLSKHEIQIRWEIAKTIKQNGRTVGGDQGKNTVLALSDGQNTPEHGTHKHTLTSVINKLCRSKKGSKSFKRTQEHRKNLINELINLLNLDNINHLKQENIININFGRNVSRSMKHWINTIIQRKINSICEEYGVRLTLQSSTYRSQRCNECGLVKSNNRKGKLFCCKSCGHADDADHNAACNHEDELLDVPMLIRMQKLNRKGFYWMSDGFYNLDGEKLNTTEETVVSSEVGLGISQAFTVPDLGQSPCVI